MQATKAEPGFIILWWTHDTMIDNIVSLQGNSLQWKQNEAIPSTWVIVDGDIASHSAPD